MRRTASILAGSISFASFLGPAVSTAGNRGGFPERGMVAGSQGACDASLCRPVVVHAPSPDTAERTASCIRVAPLPFPESPFSGRCVKTVRLCPALRCKSRLMRT